MKAGQERASIRQQRIHCFSKNGGTSWQALALPIQERVGGRAAGESLCK